MPVIRHNSPILSISVNQNITKYQNLIFSELIKVYLGQKLNPFLQLSLDKGYNP
jgi:hypothetical protein